MTDSNLPDVSTFQGLILALQHYWAEKGCVLQQPYDMEMGVELSILLLFFVYWPRAMECCLCSTLSTTYGWALWRKSKSSPALLPVSGGN